jgi:hypothetical protein
MAFVSVPFLLGKMGKFLQALAMKGFAKKSKK